MVFSHSFVISSENGLRKSLDSGPVFPYTSPRMIFRTAGKSAASQVGIIPVRFAFPAGLYQMLSTLSLIHI